MYTSAKYLIHADVRTSGVVERSDVVGAIFGQTEGLLGDELDLRDLQNSSKIGRIDVDIQSEAGRTFGTLTVASGLDRVETAVLAAALESIDRIGPCRADVTVADIEDAREAKRRELVDRATELLVELEDETLTSDKLVDEVRQRSRVAEIDEFAGLPAGPRVEESDAIIIVEGRADVRTLLQYGIKNAVAVEGTDVPDAIADLTQERTVTVFLDGDRGGDLILEELTQIGDIDYVAFAPPDQSVEDLDRAAVVAALQKKVPYEQIGENQSPREVFGPTDGNSDDPVTVDVDSPDADQTTEDADVEEDTVDAGVDEATVDAGVDEATVDAGVDEATVNADVDEATVDANVEERPPGVDDEDTQAVQVVADGEVVREESASAAVEPETSPDQDGKSDTDQTDASGQEGAGESVPQTLAGHVAAVVGDESGRVRLLDDEFRVIDETAETGAVDFVAASEQVPAAIVVDGPITQGLLDVAAQRGVGRLVGTRTDEFVKQPANVRVQTADELNATA